MLDENLSDLGKTSSEEQVRRPAPPPTDMGRVGEFDDLVESAADFEHEESPDDTSSYGTLEGSGFGSQDLLDPRDAPSDERRAVIESAVTSAVTRTLASSADAEPLPESAPTAGGFDPEDPRVRRAFERALAKAMETAFETFLAEMKRGDA